MGLLKYIWYNLNHWFYYRTGERYLIALIVFICIIFVVKSNQYISLYGQLTNHFFLDTSFDILIALVVTFSVLCLQGIVDSFVSERPKANKYLKNTDYTLKILGVTLYNLHKDPDIVEKLEVKFVEKKNTYNFQFLLLNPFSKEMVYRGENEGKNYYKLILECAKSVNNLDKIKENIKDKIVEEKVIFDYRFYDIIPTHGLIITDKTGWVGPFLYKNSGYKTKWFQISNYQAYSQYDQEFDRIWNLNKIKDISQKECYTFEDLMERYNEKCTDLFFISKNIPVHVFDEVLLQENVIVTEEKYNDLIELSRQIESYKKEGIEVDASDFKPEGNHKFRFEKEGKSYLIDFITEEEKNHPNP